MQKLRFAVIGTGNVSGTHIDAIRNCENTELKAIMSHGGTRAEMFAGKYNVKAYSEIDELLKDNEIDVVDIVSYHNLHVEYALKAVKAGKHVIVEKPIGIKLDGVDELIEEGKKNNVKIAVISQHRNDVAFSKARDMVNKGELGKIIFVDVNIIANRSDEYYQTAKWKTNWNQAGGGVLMMKAVHLIDVMLWIFGDAKSVYGKIDTIKHDMEVEDTASALIKFNNGTLASLHATTSAEYNQPFSMLICGDKKSIIVESGKLIDMGNPKYKGVFNKIKNAAVNRLPVKMQKSRRYDMGSIGQQIKMFVDNIVNNKENMLPSVEEGKKALEVILSIYKSSKSGKEIHINK